MASPAVANGVVFAGSSDHNVYAFDASNGAVRWKYTTRGQVKSTPVVVKGIVYVASGDGDGNLYTFGTQTMPPQPTPIHITLATSNPSPQAGQQFTLSGALTADSGTGVAGQPIYIQELQSSTWVNIQGPLTTDQNGAFSLAMSLTVPGPHSLRSHYGGTAQYTACDSSALTITVGGKVSPSPSRW